jgi:hypothetical protein
MREQLAAALALLPETSIASLARELADEELAALVVVDPVAFAEAVLDAFKHPAPSCLVLPKSDDTKEEPGTLADVFDKEENDSDGADDDSEQVERNQRTDNGARVLAEIKLASDLVGIAKRHIAERTGLSLNAVQWQLTRLRADGVVYVTGKAKRARYFMH